MEEQEKLVLSVSEAARLVNLSPSGYYALIREAKMPAVRIGRKLVVPRKALEQMLEDNNVMHRATA